MKRLARRVWAGATELAGTRQGAVLLVAAALVVFTIQSLGWPVAPGRDLESYLAVYADFWHTDAVFPWEMLSRTPVTPLAIGGLLDLGSPFVVELVSALLFAGSIFLYARTALLFGRGPAVLVSVALLLYPGYGVVFHELASEIVFAAGFAVWTAVVVRAALFPSAWRFAAAGGATALIALTRPANQVFLVVAVLPLALPGPWRARLGRTAAFAGVGVVLARLVGRHEPVALRRPRRHARRTGEPAVLPVVHRRPHGPAGERTRVAGARRGGRAASAHEGAVPLVRDRPRDVLLARKPAGAGGPDQPLRPALGLGLRLRDPRSRGPGGRENAPGDIRSRRSRRLREGALEAALRRTDGTRFGVEHDGVLCRRPDCGRDGGRRRP